MICDNREIWTSSFEAKTAPKRGSWNPDSAICGCVSCTEKILLIGLYLMSFSNSPRSPKSGSFSMLLQTLQCRRTGLLGNQILQKLSLYYQRIKKIEKWFTAAAILELDVVFIDSGVAILWYPVWSQPTYSPEMPHVGFNHCAQKYCWSQLQWCIL